MADNRGNSGNERLDLAREVAYIQERAASGDSRLVTFGVLLLFSTQSGDAWILDTREKRAAMIACAGTPISIDISDDGRRTRVGWAGRYRIDGLIFIFVGETAGDLDSYRGYPVQQILKQSKSDAPPLLSADRATLDLLRRMRDEAED